MIRLISAEANRLISRRMTWGVAAATLLIVAFLGWTTTQTLAPPSPEQVAQAQQAYQQAQADIAAHKDEMLAQCAANGTPADKCLPTLEGMLPPVPTHAEAMDGTMSGGTTLGGLAALVLGASFIGAEYRSGSLGNWLTFVPRRGRVFTAKLIVVALASLVIGVVAIGGLGAITTAIFTGFYPKAALAPHAWENGVRAALIVTAEGLVGFAIGLVARHSVAAIGIAFGAQIVESILSGVAMAADQHWLMDWLPGNNVNAFVRYGYTYEIPVFKISSSGSNVEMVSKTIPFANGAAYVGVAVALIVGGAYLVFRRRDVQ
jgi:ABC-2 type transport system permease protein